MSTLHYSWKSWVDNANKCQTYTTSTLKWFLDVVSVSFISNGKIRLYEVILLLKKPRLETTKRLIVSQYKYKDLTHYKIYVSHEDYVSYENCVDYKNRIGHKNYTGYES